MKKEKLILSFVAALVGILVAGIAFYFYQSTKEISIPDIKTSQDEEQSSPSPTPKPKEKDAMTVSEPKDEAIVEKKTMTIKGKAMKDSIILASSASDSVLTAASASGEFTIEFELVDGVNVIQVTAFLPDGKQKSIIRTVTYSTESF